MSKNIITLAESDIERIVLRVLNETKDSGYIYRDLYGIVENTDFISDEFINEAEYQGRKKTGTKLCARGKAAAKAKYDVYPSAYANGYAIQVCKGKIKGLDGQKRCSGTYC